MYICYDGMIHNHMLGYSMTAHITASYTVLVYYIMIIYMYTRIYIYIDIEREREREGDACNIM